MFLFVLFCLNENWSDGGNGGKLGKSGKYSLIQIECKKKSEDLEEPVRKLFWDLNSRLSPASRWIQTFQFNELTYWTNNWAKIDSQNFIETNQKNSKPIHTTFYTKAFINKIPELLKNHKISWK